jgi:hypothetical protein
LSSGAAGTAPDGQPTVEPSPPESTYSPTQAEAQRTPDRMRARSHATTIHNFPAKFAATATVLQAHGRFRGRSKSAAGALPQVSEAPDSGDCAASTAGGGDDAGRNRMRSLTDPSQLGGLLQPLSGGSDGCAQEWKMWHASSIVPLNSKVEGGRPGTPERASTHVRDIAAYIQICHI